MSWVVSYFEVNALAFSMGKTLEGAAMKYARSNNVRQMVAYTNPKGGDCPAIFSGNATKLPSHYVDLTILQEMPKERYVYILIEEDPAVMKAIDVIRNVW